MACKHLIPVDISWGVAESNGGVVSETRHSHLTGLSVGPTGVVQQVHEVAHGGLPIHSVHVTPPITAGRTWDLGKGVSMDNVSKTSTLLC